MRSEDLTKKLYLGETYALMLDRWEKLNKEIFVGDLASRVTLDSDSIKQLSKGQNEAFTMKLLAVFLGIQQGTADGYATAGETIELGDIDDQIVLHEETSAPMHALLSLANTESHNFTAEVLLRQAADHWDVRAASALAHGWMQ